jgi:kynureninase
VSIEDTVVPLSEPLVGARPGEVAVMGSLTSNLHSCMSLLYRPQLPPLPAAAADAAASTPAKFDASVPAAAVAPNRLRTRAELAGGRYKILTEAKAFPSDTYAVGSQLLLHGIAVEDGLVEVAPRPGECAWPRERERCAALAASEAAPRITTSAAHLYHPSRFPPPTGESLLRREDILAAIAREGPSLAMVLFSGVQVSSQREGARGCRQTAV